jgi:hypothetical protein
MGGMFLSSYRIHHSTKLLYPALLTHTSTWTYYYNFKKILYPYQSTAGIALALEHGGSHHLSQCTPGSSINNRYSLHVIFTRQMHIPTNCLSESQCPVTHLYVHNTYRINEWIFTQHDIGEFYKNLTIWMTTTLANLSVFLYAMSTGLTFKSQNAITLEANGIRRKNFVFITWTSDL